MSNVTLHPASQNFLVDMSDEWARPGTMCASVMCSGSQGMSRLHVWVDLMTLPFGRAICTGVVAIRMFITGAPSTRKWPVAPESEIACCTERVTLATSKMVSALGRVLRLSCLMRACHAVWRVGIDCVHGWRMGLIVAGTVSYSTVSLVSSIHRSSVD